MATQTNTLELKDSHWYVVEYDVFGSAPVLRAPAMYKKNCDAFYSYEFTGIPTRQLEVIREIEL